MKFFKSALPFSALGIAFIFLGIIMSDPRQFSFGIVWLLIAVAKHVLTSGEKNVKDQIDT
ncbi:MAG: hypothetical protein MI975_22470 [Cytophagales bacterium]|nr:hypothetical protein [Cytophagales bacterium]